jgi:hypothetical protein
VVSPVGTTVPVVGQRITIRGITRAGLSIRKGKRSQLSLPQPASNFGNGHPKSQILRTASRASGPPKAIFKTILGSGLVGQIAKSYVITSRRCWVTSRLTNRRPSRRVQPS